MSSLRISHQGRAIDAPASGAENSRAEPTDDSASFAVALGAASGVPKQGTVLLGGKTGGAGDGAAAPRKRADDLAKTGDAAAAATLADGSLLPPANLSPAPADSGAAADPNTMLVAAPLDDHRPTQVAAAGTGTGYTVTANGPLGPFLSAEIWPAPASDRRSFAQGDAAAGIGAAGALAAPPPPPGPPPATGGASTASSAPAASGVAPSTRQPIGMASDGAPSLAGAAASAVPSLSVSGHAGGPATAPNPTPNSPVSITTADASAAAALNPTPNSPVPITTADARAAAAPNPTPNSPVSITTADASAAAAPHPVPTASLSTMAADASAPSPGFALPPTDSAVGSTPGAAGPVAASPANSGIAPASPSLFAGLAASSPPIPAGQPSAGDSAFGDRQRDRFTPVVAVSDAARVGAATVIDPSGDAPVPASAPSQTPAATTATTTDTISDQVASHLVRLVSSGPRDMVVRLRPPELGDLTVRVAISGRDVSAWFAASQPEVQSAISAAMGQLQTDLGNAGYNLDGAWVGADASGAGQQGSNLPPPPVAAGLLAAAPAAALPASAASRPAVSSGLNIYV